MKKNIIIWFFTIFLLIIIPSVVFAGNALEITSYGDAKLIAPVFEGLSAFVTSGDWKSLAGLAGMIGLITIAVIAWLTPMIGNNPRGILDDFLRLILIGMIASGVVMSNGVLTKNVTIVDAYTGDTYVVNNVPAMAAYPAWFVNSIATGLASLFDKFFGADLPYFNPREAGIDDLSLIPERLENLRLPDCDSSTGLSCSSYNKWRNIMKEYITNCVMPYFGRCEAGEIVDCCGMGGSNSNTSLIFRTSKDLLHKFLGMEDYSSSSADRCFPDPNEFAGSGSCREDYDYLKNNWDNISSTFKQLALREVIPDFQPSSVLIPNFYNSTVTVSSYSIDTFEDVFQTYLEDVVGITDLSSYGGVAGFLLNTVIVNEMRQYSPVTDADYARAIAYATAAHTALTWRIIGRQVMGFVEATAYALCPILLLFSMIPVVGKATWALFMALIMYVAFQFPLATLLTGLGVKKLISAYGGHIIPDMSFYNLYIQIIKIGRQNGIVSAYLMTASPALAGIITTLFFKSGVSGIAGSFAGGGAETAQARTAAQTALGHYYSHVNPELADAQIKGEVAQAHREMLSPGQRAEILQSQGLTYSVYGGVKEAYRSSQSALNVLNREAAVRALSNFRGATAARDQFIKQEAATLGLPEQTVADALEKKATNTQFWAQQARELGREGLFNAAMLAYADQGMDTVTKAVKAGDPELAERMTQFLSTGTGDQYVQDLFYNHVKSQAQSIGNNLAVATALGDEKSTAEFKGQLSQLQRYAKKWHVDSAVQAGLDSIKVENMSIASEKEARGWERAFGLKSGTLHAGDNIKISGWMDPKTGNLQGSFVFSRHGSEIFRRSLSKQIFSPRNLRTKLTDQEANQIEDLRSVLPNSKYFNQDNEIGQNLRKAYNILGNIASQKTITGKDLMTLHNIAGFLRDKGMLKYPKALDYQDTSSVLGKYAPLADWENYKSNINKMIAAAEKRGDVAFANNMRTQLHAMEKAIESGQSVEITKHADPDTGQLSTIEASFGGKTYFFADNEQAVKDIGKGISLEVGGERIDNLSGSKKVEGDYVTFQGKMDSSQLGQLEKALRRQKYYNAAEAVHKLAESGKLADVNLRADTRGNILGLKAGNDVLVSEKDLATSDKGSRSWEGQTHAIDYADFRIDHPIEGATSFVTSDSPNSKVVQRWSHHALHTKGAMIIERNALTDMFNKEVQREGQVISSANLSANVQGSGYIDVKDDSEKALWGKLIEGVTGFVGKAGVRVSSTGTGSLDRKNAEVFTTNLLRASIARAQLKAYRASLINGKPDEEIFAEQYLKNVKAIYKDLEMINRTSTEFEFGASSPIGEVLAETGRFIKKHPGKVTLKDLSQALGKIAETTTKDIFAPAGRDIAKNTVEGGRILKETITEPLMPPPHVTPHSDSSPKPEAKTK